MQVEKIVYRDKPVEVCLLDNQNWCMHVTDKDANTQRGFNMELRMHAFVIVSSLVQVEKVVYRDVDRPVEVCLLEKQKLCP